MNKEELIDQIKCYLGRSINIYGTDHIDSWGRDPGILISRSLAREILAELESWECRHTSLERPGEGASWTCNICGKHVRDYVNSRHEDSHNEPLEVEFEDIHYPSNGLRSNEREAQPLEGKWVKNNYIVNGIIVGNLEIWTDTCEAFLLQRYACFTTESAARQWVEEQWKEVWKQLTLKI